MRVHRDVAKLWSEAGVPRLLSISMIAMLSVGLSQAQTVSERADLSADDLARVLKVTAPTTDFFTCKAVYSATRDACCMLCVTITIVN